MWCSSTVAGAVAARTHHGNPVSVAREKGQWNPTVVQPVWWILAGGWWHRFSYGGSFLEAPREDMTAGALVSCWKTSNSSRETHRKNEGEPTNRIIAAILVTVEELRKDCSSHEGPKGLEKICKKLSNSWLAIGYIMPSFYKSYPTASRFLYLSRKSSSLNYSTATTRPTTQFLPGKCVIYITYIWRKQRRKGNSGDVVVFMDIGGVTTAEEVKSTRLKSRKLLFPILLNTLTGGALPAIAKLLKQFYHKR